jgi:mRNA-binding protein PUF3
MFKLSSDSIGTYPIQTIIEHVGSKNEKVIIVNSLKDNIKELSVDPFGSHVLEKLLTCFEEEYINFIYNYIVDNFLELANNNNGICVVKKILTFTHKKNIHDKIKIIVKENALQFISHPYANFVIQIVVECWSDYKDILILFEKKYYNLSLEKYASNVVERCIEKDEEILNNYIDEIIDSNRIYEVMRSNYGNYVIQKAIKLSKGENKKKLVFNAAKDVNKLNDAKLIIKWKSILSPHINELSKEQLAYLNEQNYF